MGIFDIFSAKPGQQAAADQIAADQRAAQDVSKQFGLGRGALTTDYAKALDPWTKQFAYGQQGENELGDAMGMNGPEGSARAMQAFQNDPGYQFRIQQAMNGVMANQSRLGQLDSGNTDIALQQNASNIANQGWGDYITRLQQFLPIAQNAASGIAGVNTGLGNQMAANYTGLGNALGQIDISQGKAQAAGDLAAQQASANLWGTGLALAGDAASAMGGGSGKNLFGSFMPKGAISGGLT